MQEAGTARGARLAPAPGERARWTWRGERRCAEGTSPAGRIPGFWARGVRRAGGGGSGCAQGLLTCLLSPQGWGDSCDIPGCDRSLWLGAEPGPQAPAHPAGLFIPRAEVARVSVIGAQPCSVNNNNNNNRYAIPAFRAIRQMEGERRPVCATPCTLRTRAALREIGYRLHLSFARPAGLRLLRKPRARPSGSVCRAGSCGSPARLSKVPPEQHLMKMQTC